MRNLEDDTGRLMLAAMFKLLGKNLGTNEIKLASSLPRNATDSKPVLGRIFNDNIVEDFSAIRNNRHTASL